MGSKVYALRDVPDEDRSSPDEPVEIPITDTFDLHSVPARDVKPIIEAYLLEAHLRGFTAIRIIHGRGIGVRREIVRSILQRTPFVLAYGDAPAEAGGWGATLATLRQES
jgi:dsDNA-specific endonuclease/ATPase MutS2